MHDIVIIGGGPAGLSAALNGAAEGLDTLLLERTDSIGGQAGTSSRIENYLGFPNGVAGQPLTTRAAKQAKRLGANLKLEHEVVDVTHDPVTETWMTSCATGSQHVSKALIVASGVDYRRLGETVDPHERALYGAPASAHEECKDKDVIVVGGGNSAGQAALNLAKIGARVTLLVRRPLRQTMSQYLIERIALEPNITGRLGEIGSIYDDPPMVALKDHTELDAERVFAYIGMIPRTGFIEHCCTIHRPGFIETDENFSANEHGLFVAGDVRKGSMKRVAAAVGEGAITAAAAWRYIANVNGN